MSFYVGGYKKIQILATHFIDVRQNQISKIPSVVHRITSEKYTEGPSGPRWELELYETAGAIRWDICYILDTNALPNYSGGPIL